MNILVVEDEPALRQTVVAALVLCGHAVVGAENGIEALARVHDLRPDLVVLDLQMPEMDGWEFQRQFRRLPECATIPVVIMSAAEHAALDDLDAAALLAKPFDLDELMDVIDRLLPVRVHGESIMRVPDPVTGVLVARSSLDDDGRDTARTP